MSDSEIFMDGVEYARDFPNAPMIPPAYIAMTRIAPTVDVPVSSARVWINGWKAGRN